MKQDNSYGNWKRENHRDRPGVKTEYERLMPEMAVVHKIIEARMRKQLTQQKLADKLNTTQSVISRLESGRGNPSVAFLQRLAEATGTRLEIRFVS